MKSFSEYKTLSEKNILQHIIGGATKIIGGVAHAGSALIGAIASGISGGANSSTGGNYGDSISQHLRDLEDNRRAKRKEKKKTRKERERADAAAADASMTDEARRAAEAAAVEAARHAGGADEKLQRTNDAIASDSAGFTFHKSVSNKLRQYGNDIAHGTMTKQKIRNIGGHVFNARRRNGDFSHGVLSDAEMNARRREIVDYGVAHWEHSGVAHPDHLARLQSYIDTTHPEWKDLHENFSENRVFLNNVYKFINHRLSN